MKKILFGIFCATVAAGCNSQQDQALKSADKDFILKVANENFAKKKYDKALELYDRLPNLVAGTDDAQDVVFNSAYANYYEKQYRLAGHQFKKFATTFPQDPRTEEAAYMSALCYYEGSLDYNLDQKNTLSAIDELQNFLNNYPNSERSKNITKLIDELNYKLEYKAYQNAKQYYSMGQYKAATVALQNVLDDFPGTSLRPKIEEYILRSHYELSINSRFDLKKDRLIYTQGLAKKYAVSKHKNVSELALSLQPKLDRAMKDFEAENIRYQETLKKAEARREREEKRTRSELQKHSKDVKETNKALRDSATIANPPASLEIPIKN